MGGMESSYPISLLRGGAQQSYVVSGARTACSFGDKQGRLVIPVSHGVYTKGKAQLNIMDFKPIVNIMPFGMCSSMANPTVAAATAANDGVLKKMPCIPVVTMPWAAQKTDILVENFYALLNKCTNMCMYCGRITIEDDGQE